MNTEPRDEHGVVVITNTYLDRTVIQHGTDYYELTIEMDGSSTVEIKRTERITHHQTGVTTVSITTSDTVEIQTIDANGDIIRHVIETNDTHTTTEGNVTVVVYLNETKTMTVETDGTKTITTTETDTSRSVTTTTIGETITLLYLLPENTLLRTTKVTTKVRIIVRNLIWLKLT